MIGQIFGHHLGPLISVVELLIPCYSFSDNYYRFFAGLKGLRETNYEKSILPYSKKNYRLNYIYLTKKYPKRVNHPL